MNTKKQRLAHSQRRVKMELKLDREYRIAEIRAQMGENGALRLHGTPILFEVPTTIRGINSKGELQEFIEIIDRRALDKTDMSDTALKHDHKDILARVRNKSLQLIKTEAGLDMGAVLSDTQKSKDVYTEVRDGLLPEMSFAFPLSSQGTKSEWSRSSDGTPIRRITHIPKLIDVSTVYNGAYKDTKVFARSLDDMDIELRALDNEKSRLDSNAEIELLKLKARIKGAI